jgi:hypothetical protein
MEEIWKSIKDLKGYEVSSLGNVRSIDRSIIGKDGVKQHFKGNIISKFKDSRGYIAVTLTYKNNYKRFLVHRLVAEAFIPNPNNYPCINHKDENKSNNNVDNLEWCTVKYNNSYGDRIKRIRYKTSYIISQLDKNNNLIGIYRGIMLASKINRFEFASVQRCVFNKQHYSYGYKFRLANKEEIDKLGNNDYIIL